MTVGSPAQRREFRAFLQAMKEGFFAMTAAPESGDRKLRDEQVEQLCAIYAGIGYTALNARVVAERNLLDILPRGIMWVATPCAVHAFARSAFGHADRCRRDEISPVWTCCPPLGKSTLEW